MGHKHWILLGLCLTLAGGTEIIQSVEAKQPPQVQKQESVSQKSPSNNKSAKSRSWVKRVLKLFQPLIKPDKKGSILGTRGGLCAIAPGMLENENHIWSSQPLFLWQGQAQELQVSDELTGEILWQQSLADQQRSTTYSGPALQPGQYYVWMLLNETTQKETVFKIIDSEQRSKINTHLNQISSDIEEINIPSRDTELLKADYFAEQGMWSDTLTTALHGKDVSSSKLVRVTDQLSQDFCGGENTVEETTTEMVAIP